MNMKPAKNIVHSFIQQSRVTILAQRQHASVGSPPKIQENLVVGRQEVEIIALFLNAIIDNDFFVR
jgi:predicted aspartyl protease